MFTIAKKAALALGLGAMALGAVPATAQPGWNNHGDRHDDRHGDRHDRGRGNGWQHNGNSRDWRNYDWNRHERGARGYYAERYYRGGYRPMRVTRETRIYRGSDNRYYCRRNDGTTGLIVGAALGGVVGNSLGRGDSGLLATLLGAGGGALLGQQIDRGNVSCR